jgi:site-specific recombinase XerC
MDQTTVNLLWAVVLDQKSKNTKRAYRSDFRTFSDMIGAQSEVDAFAQLLESSEAAEGFLTRVRDGHTVKSHRQYTAPKSINRMLVTLRLLVRAAHHNDILTGHVQNVRSLRVGYGISGTMISNEEIISIIDHATLDDTNIGRRLHAFLWLSLDLNLHLEAIRMLNIGDLDMQSMRIRVSDRRTHEFIWREMSTATSSALARWLEVRVNWKSEPESPAFIAVAPGYKNGRLGTNKIGLDISRAFLRAGLRGGHRTLIRVSRRETFMDEAAVRLLEAYSRAKSSYLRPQRNSVIVALERQFGRLIADTRARRFVHEPSG